MLQRLALAQLAQWKRRAARKPVLIDGARQVGKSWLVGRLFGPREFRKVHWLDFRAEPRLANLFVESLDPATIVANIEVERNERIDIERDLLFFDEVAECQGAVDSLKYFAERMPSAFVCASGSNIGLLRSFPVGQVEQFRPKSNRPFNFLVTCIHHSSVFVEFGVDVPARPERDQRKRPFWNGRGAPSRASCTSSVRTRRSACCR